MTNAQKYAQWMDDQLDLYNYAVRIGDDPWRLELLRQLQDKESFHEQLLRDQARSQLCSEFEKINRRLEGLYGRLKEAENDEIRAQLWEAAWKLRKERSHLAARLRESAGEESRQPGRSSLRG